mmetsp:Transcript_7024/g.25129  ORF Transcript_7024/g.25129 Transcript_7024/m.25129 type:complete len:206 (-) Transcript_7024:3340-3957(-)
MRTRSKGVRCPLDRGLVPGIGKGPSLPVTWAHVSTAALTVFEPRKLIGVAIALVDERGCEDVEHAEVGTLGDAGAQGPEARGGELGHVGAHAGRFEVQGPEDLASDALQSVYGPREEARHLRAFQERREPRVRPPEAVGAEAEHDAEVQPFRKSAVGRALVRTQERVQVALDAGLERDPRTLVCHVRVRDEERGRAIFCGFDHVL